jgi:NTE family protein
MLQALLDVGIRPDLVLGSSAGALNGALFASTGDSSAVQALRLIWYSLRRTHVFPVRPHHVIAGIAGRRDSLVPSSAMRRFIERNIPYRDLAETAVTFGAMATCVGTGESVVLSEGDVVRALLASTAVPGIYSPVELDGRHLMDGSIAADYAVAAAIARGATTIYVLPAASSRSDRPTNAIAMVRRATSHLIDRVNRDSVAAAVAGAPGVDVVVLPAPTTRAGSFDFSDSRRLMSEGHRLAAAHLTGLGSTAPLRPADSPMTTVRSDPADHATLTPA